MALLHLDWLRGSEGYRIERRPAEPPTGIGKRGPDVEMRWHQSGGFFIVRNGGRHRESAPLGCDGLWKQLAGCRTPTHVLEFVSRWGFLQKAKAKEEPIGIALARAEWLRTISDEADRGEWSEIARQLAHRAAGPFGAIGQMGVTFEYAEGMERPELQFRPRSLDAAICVQALMDISGNAKLRKCVNPACPEWFKYGPGTAHRETAMYCAPKCQKAHAYAKSKETTK